MPPYQLHHVFSHVQTSNKLGIHRTRQFTNTCGKACHVGVSHVQISGKPCLPPCQCIVNTKRQEAFCISGVCTAVAGHLRTECTHPQQKSLPSLRWPLTCRVQIDGDFGQKPWSDSSSDVSCGGTAGSSWVCMQHRPHEEPDRCALHCACAVLGHCM